MILNAIWIELIKHWVEHNRRELKGENKLFKKMHKHSKFYAFLFLFWWKKIFESVILASDLLMHLKKYSKQSRKQVPNESRLSSWTSFIFIFNEQNFKLKIRAGNRGDETFALIKFRSMNLHASCLNVNLNKYEINKIHK